MSDTRVFLLAAVLLSWGCAEEPAVGQTCGAGTRNSNGQCVPELTTLCGAGTVASNGRCVAQSQVACGEGTVLEGSTCVSSLACGTGTVQQGSECVPESTLSCGAGTVQQGSECVPESTLSCGAGTVQVASMCRPDLSTVCGTDTIGASDGNTCVSVVACGEGTVRNGNHCRPWVSACGAGTIFSNNMCEVSPGAVCGAGTVWQGGQCVKPVPSPSLEAFSSSAALEHGFHRTRIIAGSTYAYEYRAAVTDLSQVSAEGWAQSASALVGEGAAVHMKFWGPLAIDASTPFVAQISSSFSGGVCQTSLSPESKPPEYGRTYGNFFAWSSIVPSMSVCAIGGSIKVERLTIGGADTARLTFDVQFSDGTIWTEKVFEMPWRQNF